MRRATIVLIAVLCGCAPAGDGDAPDDAAATDSPAAEPAAGAAPVTADPAAEPATPGVRGRVVVSGTEGSTLTTLQLAAGPPVFLRGSLEPELRTLAGATVVVRGTETGTAARRSIDVRAYDIVEIDGERPFVGTVLADGRLAAGRDTLTLLGAPAELRPGTRVWITGARTGTRLRLTSWGVIGAGR